MTTTSGTLGSWELCVLFALQGGLRSGEIWVLGSRRYADPASYLIAVEAWPVQRAEVMELTGTPATFAERLTAIDAEMSRYLDELEALLAEPDSPVSVDAGGQLHLKALTAEVIGPEVLVQRDAVVARLPRVPLTELLIEVDRKSGFSAHLTHAGGASPRHPELEHRRNLYAAILSLACNFGSTRMAELTGISADTIDWTVRWYLREDTLRAANAAIVNAHHRHPLATAQGGGTLSSSDGLRMPMRGKSLTGRALSRYFVHEGLTSYTHIPDQYSTYGTQIIVSTERDATFTLDEILGNTTELPIAEHTTDSHGQTLATFALFDLTGFRLSPRIATLVLERPGLTVLAASPRHMLALKVRAARQSDVADIVFSPVSSERPVLSRPKALRWRCSRVSRSMNEAAQSWPISTTLCETPDYRRDQA